MKTILDVSVVEPQNVQPEFVGAQLGLHWNRQSKILQVQRIKFTDETECPTCTIHKQAQFCPQSNFQRQHMLQEDSDTAEIPKRIASETI